MHVLVCTALLMRRYDRCNKENFFFLCCLFGTGYPRTFPTALCEHIIAMYRSCEDICDTWNSDVDSEKSVIRIY